MAPEPGVLAAAKPSIDPLPPREPVGITENELDSRFGAHEVGPDQRAAIGEMRAIIRRVAGDVVRLTPPSREQSYALTLLEHAGFSCIAAISRRG